MENNRIVDFSKTSLHDIYGENCFNDATMREMLPKAVYKELKEVQQGNKELTLETANAVASAMKNWAVSKGATHFTHWFQPLNDLTAEKHDSFISPTEDGKVILEFSGKELIKGESDASSFPSGGLRATFEARGYTAWDTTSPAFLMSDNTGVTLNIPTAFFSYTGESLDKKGPLLKSMNALDKASVRLLRSIGNKTVKRVSASVGPEQEYFLVDRKYYDTRSDLVLCKRTLYGSMPGKGQELNSHYYGNIQLKVADFMRELNCELWRMGIPAKTQHNEVAPNQFEIAPIYSTVNVATDQNQLTMLILRKVAKRHGLAVLLNEKPFEGVNGSGKHNNWSLTTDDGTNLMDPGDDPKSNTQFLLFLCAFIKACDKYSGLLRFSASNAGNDYRLGGSEAPPAVISVYLGSELEEILEKLSKHEDITSAKVGKIQFGVNSLPTVLKDSTDRNRTSPMAFTGNKFEFRMVGSSASIAKPNTVINTIMASVLDEFATELEKSKKKSDTILKLIIDTYKAHKRVIFNGNGYSDEWKAEAERRGLPNITNNVDAIAEILKPEAIEVFERMNVLTRQELEARYNIYLQVYSRQIKMEATVMLQMARKDIVPATLKYVHDVAATVNEVKESGVKCPLSREEEMIASIMDSVDKFMQTCLTLEKELKNAHEISDPFEKACAYRDKVFKTMKVLRSYGDALERVVGKTYWPFATYEDLLFNI
ncbi:MAG: glutamine synthetase III [Spirochaetia bacterium]|nr:glutamine synthetase III [Spirochaetia bacterium]